MKLLITIDTEEDNWGRYSTTDNPVTNILRIAQLQELFDKFNVTPTYLVSYPVATNATSVEVLKAILSEGKCEIGAHCHSWNTPPFETHEQIRKQDTMLCNLPEELQFLKISTLHRVICENFGTVPVSFRAGRWSFGSGVARSLCRLGYRVDTSITPFVSWTHYHGPDFSESNPAPSRFVPQDDDAAGGGVLQVPVTIGFLQSNARFCKWLMKKTESRSCKLLRIKGILDFARLLNMVWLSPELSDASAMIRLGARMEKRNSPCLNLTFHSNSLVGGLNPFVKTVEEEREFIGKLEKFLEFARDAGWQSQTLSQFEQSHVAPICGAGSQ